MVVASTEEVHSGGRIWSFDPSAHGLQVDKGGQGLQDGSRAGGGCAPRTGPLAVLRVFGLLWFANLCWCSAGLQSCPC